MKHVDLLSNLSELNIGRKDLSPKEPVLRGDNSRTSGERADGICHYPERGQTRLCFVMREIDDMEGIRNGGQSVNNLRYADDTVLIANSEDKLQRKI